MKTAVSHEFFYYNKQLGPQHHDFTNTNSLPLAQRMEFLTNYAEYMERSYHIPRTPRLVVDDEEIAEALHELNDVKVFPRVSKHLELGTMQASLQHVYSEYQGWSLYTKKTSVIDDSIVFDGEEIAPTPAAVYTFDSQERLQKFAFSLYMDSKYAAPISGVIGDCTPGRTVELRAGIHDIVKLQFYSNGTWYVRVGNECPYHLKNICMGDFAFDELLNFTILLGEEDFKVVFNGTESENFPVSSKLNPDILFIGSGMFRVGRWDFIPVSLKFDSREITEFFAPKTCASEAFASDVVCEAELESLGEVTLPYRVGTYENRDKALVLEKTFDVAVLMHAILNISSLDPGGCVWINETCVADTDRFESMHLDVSSNLRVGENHLKIVVNPRAPEVLFNWHRQTDAYNGWFCEEVSLDCFHEVQIDKVTVLPISVEGNEITCKVSADLNTLKSDGLEDYHVMVYLRKVHPVAEQDAICVGNFDASETFSQTLTFTADAWTIQNPNLYEVRIAVCDADGQAIDDTAVETGFRIIEQKDGDILLNGEKIILTGALTMQFLPPHHETPATHICPRTEQIVAQELMVKKMNGNTLRMHILGYGSNDARYARIADRLGLMLIWITRYIDSVEQMALQEEWAAKDGYIRQISERLNHPSIIIWEGSNEFHPSLDDIDRICNQFVPAVKSVDTTRMICPVSHLYYAGDSYRTPGCAFYNDAGTKDHDGNPVQASPYWTDPLVIRSAHTYHILLGYGTTWDRLRTQAWSMQKELVESKEHAYMVSEFAVIGRQNPDTPEAQEYFNDYSYEFADERASGVVFTKEQWKQSQAYQALAAKADVQMMRIQGIDGMLWCCLQGGANDGGYLKPPIDCYGYPKLAFYTLREGYQELFVATDNIDVVKGDGFRLTPEIYGIKKGEKYRLTARVTDYKGEAIVLHVFEGVAEADYRIKLPTWQPRLPENGYYGVRFELTIV